jgi:hypothetical protein
MFSVIRMGMNFGRVLGGGGGVDGVGSSYILCLGGKNGDKMNIGRYIQ